MLDLTIILAAVIPALITAVTTYLVTRRKNNTAEKINRAQVESDIQNHALGIVKTVMDDMRSEFKREIDDLKKENLRLEERIVNNDLKISDQTKLIEDLQDKLSESDLIIKGLRSEVVLLKKTNEMYENEIQRLKTIT